MVNAQLAFASPVNENRKSIFSRCTYILSGLLPSERRTRSFIAKTRRIVGPNGFDFAKAEQVFRYYQKKRGWRYHIGETLPLIVSLLEKSSMLSVEQKARIFSLFAEEFQASASWFVADRHDFENGAIAFIGAHHGLFIDPTGNFWKVHLPGRGWSTDPIDWACFRYNRMRRYLDDRSR